MNKFEKYHPVGCPKMSYYDRGKDWSKRNFLTDDEKHIRYCIWLFESYWSDDSIKITNTGYKLTKSRRQFYYGARNGLREMIGEKPISS